MDGQPLMQGKARALGNGGAGEAEEDAVGQSARPVVDGSARNLGDRLPSRSALTAVAVDVERRWLLTMPLNWPKNGEGSELLLVARIGGYGCSSGQPFTLPC
jgi:hypothetical protein